MPMGGPGAMNMGIGPMAMFGMQGGQQQRPKGERPPTYSLCVSNLSEKTYDLDLYKFFSSHKFQVASAKVMRDRETEKLRGFAYLNFYSEEEAERCLAEMNNAVIDGKHIVLSRKKNDDFDSKANVVVKNLAKDITQKDMSDLFSKYGAIKSCKLEVYESGDSRGFGYVQFDTPANAQKAIEALDGSEQHGKKIGVMIHAKRDEREGGGESKYTNLFVSNLPSGYTADQLKDLFKPYGQIVSAEMNAKENGTGFVCFGNHTDAAKALDAVNLKIKIGDQALFVSPHIYRKQKVSAMPNPVAQSMREQFRSNLFVKFIPKSVSKDELQKEFEKAGEIASIKLKDHEQKINGETFVNYQIGYVLFTDIEGAQKCIRLYDQSTIFGSKPMKVDFWQSKDDLKK